MAHTQQAQDVRVMYAGETHTFAVEPKSTVADACFAVAGEAARKRNAFFLWLPRTMRYYLPDDFVSAVALKKGDVLEVLPRFVERTVVWFPAPGTDCFETRITVDQLASPQTAANRAAKSLGISHNDRPFYSLYACDDDGGDLFMPKMAFVRASRSAGAKDGSELVLRRRFYFTTEAETPEADFANVCEFLENGFYVCEKDTAVEIAASLAQVFLGDYSDKRDKKALRDFLPPEWREHKRLAASVASQYSQLVGMTRECAMQRATRAARSILTFGMTLFFVQEESARGLTELLGVSANSICRLVPEGNELIEEHSLSDLKNVYGNHVCVGLTWRSASANYVCYCTKTREIELLVEGYVSEWKMKHPDHSFLNPVAECAPDQASSPPLAADDDSDSLLLSLLPSRWKAEVVKKLNRVQKRVYTMPGVPLLQKVMHREH
eukprot:m51a1_g7208 putative talin 2 (437) ;mRNA; r:222583-223893